MATFFLADDLASRIDVRPLWVGPLVLAGLVAGGVASWWAWATTGYRVTDDEVELRTGVLFRRHRRLPLARLETIDVARPVGARVFGLAQVRLEAVSQGESEVRLSYLDHDVALELRDELRGRLEGSTAAVAEKDAAEPGRLPDAIRVPTGEIVVATVLTRVGPVLPVVLGAGLVILGVAGPGAAAAFAAAFGFPVTFGSLVVGLVEAERLYGFTLTERGRGFDVRRGLLNEMHQVVPADRVQAVGIVEPFLWRRFGRARLVVDVAGYRGGNQKDRQSSSVLLPIAPSYLVADVLRRVQPDLRFDELSFVPAPAASRWRAPVRRRSYHVAWAATHAVVRRGLLCRQTDIVPHRKVQSVRVTQGPWQRALGLATLHLDTAGTRIHARAPQRDREEAERLAWASRRAAGPAGP